MPDISVYDLDKRLFNLQDIDRLLEPKESSIRFRNSFIYRGAIFYVLIHQHNGYSYIARICPNKLRELPANGTIQYKDIDEYVTFTMNLYKVPDKDAPNICTINSNNFIQRWYVPPQTDTVAQMIYIHAYLKNFNRFEELTKLKFPLF
jgi:hypothetical protein